MTPGKRALTAALTLALAAFVSVTRPVRADSPPSQQQIQFAKETSDLMLKTIVAALLQEFAETADDFPTNGCGSCLPPATCCYYHRLKKASRWRIFSKTAA